MSEVQHVRTIMPDPKHGLGEAVWNFPESGNGLRWGEQEVKRQALIEHRDLIASGVPVVVEVPGYGTVSFEFRPSIYYSAPGAKDGTFRPQ